MRICNSNDKIEQNSFSVLVYPHESSSVPILQFTLSVSDEVNIPPTRLFSTLFTTASSAYFPHDEHAVCTEIVNKYVPLCPGGLFE